jgi:hypothetical protein
MQYELFKWERQSIGAPPSETAYVQELDRIKTAFMKVFVGSEPNTAVERYVRIHQAGVLHLSRELEQAAGARSKKGFIYGGLNEVSAFLERHRPDYLDPDQPLPSSRSRYFLNYIRESLPQVKERLETGGADERLSEIILGLLQEAMGDDALTYRQWFPLKDLVTYILQLPRVDKGETSVKGDLSVSQRLVELLYHLNLNTTTVYRYIKSTVLELVEDKEFISEKLPELGRVRRYINWLEHKPGYQFVDGRVSLTRMLTAWLEELEQSKVKEALQTGEESKDADESGFGLDSKKVITSLTVNELGLLVRLFMETGVFRTRNRKGLARFMAQNVVTLKKEAVDEVSSAHLYGTLYSMTDATMDSVQSILNRMLVRLGKLRLEQRKKKPAKAKK